MKCFELLSNATEGDSGQDILQELKRVIDVKDRNNKLAISYAIENDFPDEFIVTLVKWGSSINADQVKMPVCSFHIN